MRPLRSNESMGADNINKQKYERPMDRTCRVLWITKGLDRGGAEMLMLELARSDQLKQFEIHVVSVLANHMAMREEFSQTGVVVKDLGVTRTLSLVWIFRLARLMRCGDYDVFHSHSPLPGSIARLIKTFAGLGGMVTTEHAMPNVYKAPTRLLNRLTAGLDDHRIAVSLAVKTSQDSPRTVPCEVVYHGRSVDEPAQEERSRLLSRTRASLGLERDTLLVVAIANLRPEKNLGLLVAAFERLSEEIPNARLIIVGGGTEYDHLKEEVHRRDLDGRVRLVGHDSSVWKYLAMASIVALSSSSEGLPVSVMEAMLQGVPVVSTNVGGVSEAVVDGITGYLVQPGNCQELAERMQRLLCDRPLREEFGAAAVLRGKALFSPQLACRRHAELYRSWGGRVCNYFER